MKRFLPLLAAFVLCLSLTVPAFAIEEAPNPYSAWTEEYQERFPYAVLWKNPNGTYVLYLCSLRPHYDGSTNLIIDNNDDELSYLAYIYLPGRETDWRYDAGYSNGYTINRTYGEILASSFDIMNDGTGSVWMGTNMSFFPSPLPLAEQIQMVTGETLTTQTVPALGGTMKVLVLCGVGLIASLVVLKLFGKRSLIFRS